MHKYYAHSGRLPGGHNSIGLVHITLQLESVEVEDKITLLHTNTRTQMFTESEETHSVLCVWFGAVAMCGKNISVAAFFVCICECFLGGGRERVVFSVRFVIGSR